MITFHPTDPKIVVISNDSTELRLLRLRPGEQPEELATLKPPRGSAVGGARFTPDGSRLVTNSPDGVRVWDLALIERELRSLRLSCEDWHFAGADPPHSVPSDPIQLRVDMGSLAGRRNDPIRVAHPIVAGWAVQRAAKVPAKSAVALGLKGIEKPLRRLYSRTGETGVSAVRISVSNPASRARRTRACDRSRSRHM